MGLDTVELIMAVETRFGIRIEDREAERASTVGMLHQLVLDTLRARNDPVNGDEVFSQVREVICSPLGIGPEKGVPDAYVVDDLGAD